MTHNEEFINKTLCLGKSFFTLFCSPWEKHITFSGRARRRELWLFSLVNIVISMAIISTIDVGIPEFDTGVFLVWLFVALLPTIALLSRRLHDIGTSGWWQLIYWLFVFVFLICSVSFITSLNAIFSSDQSNGLDLPYEQEIIDVSPFLGGICFLILLFWKGQAGDNKYGANPRTTSNITK